MQDSSRRSNAATQTTKSIGAQRSQVVGAGAVKEDFL